MTQCFFKIPVLCPLRSTVLALNHFLCSPLYALILGNSVASLWLISWSYVQQKHDSQALWPVPKISSRYSQSLCALTQVRFIRLGGRDSWASIPLSHAEIRDNAPRHGSSRQSVHVHSIHCLAIRSATTSPPIVRLSLAASSLIVVCWVYKPT